MKYNEEKIGKIIHSERAKQHMSQAKLGEKLNVTGKQISNYEKGKPIPPIDVLLHMCEVFHCELGYLLGEPDYSEGTKFETAMSKSTGLSIISLNNIRKITGTDKHCLNFGNQAETYQSLLNSLFSSPEFISFIECLYDLDTAVSEFNNAFALERETEKEFFDEAFEQYKSSIDYEHDSSAPKLTPKQSEAMNTIDSAIDRQNKLSYPVKIARYELHKSFEALIESLYPSEKLNL